MMTFKDRYLAGEVEFEAIDDYVEATIPVLWPGFWGLMRKKKTSGLRKVMKL